MNFSIEIGPKTKLDTLPALKDVYITMLPGGDFRETAQQAINLVKIELSIDETKLEDSEKKDIELLKSFIQDEVEREDNQMGLFD